MKKKLTFIIFFLYINNLSFAEGINDIEIAGIKYGDSLLLYVDENTIKETKVPYPMTKYSTSRFEPEIEGYDYIEISYKTNDKDYKILELTGYIFVNDMEECITQKKNIVDKYLTILKKTKKEDRKRNHPYDKTGKSKMFGTTYIFNNSEMVQFLCNDWSKELEVNYADHLAFSAVNLDFLRWKEKLY
tara:strand:+ start:231 stop:794 length:564 start_codon:yes stop_codon:yes gene_type:complete